MLDRTVSLTGYLTTAAIGTALAVALPAAFHALGLGPAFLPMQLPVLLVGALGGARVGCLVGVVAPTLSHLLTGMPPMVPPVVPLMTAELATYGAVAGTMRGWLRAHTRQGYRTQRGAGGRLSLAQEYVWLLAAMVAGRLALGLTAAVAGPALGLRIPAVVYLSTALVTGLPGLAVQLAMVPILVRRLDSVVGPQTATLEAGIKSDAGGERNGGGESDAQDLAT